MKQRHYELRAILKTGRGERRTYASSKSAMKRARQIFNEGGSAFVERDGAVIFHTHGKAQENDSTLA